jgi:uncharacterized membrane protein YqaE (UPF0057 family)
MRRVSIYSKLAAVFVVFLILSFLIGGKGSDDFINVVLTVAAFVFGIILAFSISNRHSRLSDIREALRMQDGIFLNIYELSKMYGRKISDKVKKLIDDILIVQIDNELEEFDRCVPRIEILYKFIEKLKIKKKQQEQSYQVLVNNASELIKIEKEVSFSTKNKILMYEWVSLLILGSIIIFCIFYLKNPSITSNIVVAIISATIVLLILVLHQLDTLSWQEENWIWIPLTNVFRELGLIPYFPGDIFEDKRLAIEKIKKWGNINQIRIAQYPNYPDRTGKIVEVVKLK